MGLMTEADLERLVADGCKECGGRKLEFQMYVDGLLPLQGGERVGKLKWCYDGEKFVDGVFEVTCLECDRTIFESAVCPRCHAEGGLEKALLGENAYPIPAKCPGCGGDEVRYIAMIPAETTYEGTRAAKATTDVAMEDAGFHGYRVDCRDCGTVAELVDRCPMCDAPGPLRERP